MSTPVITVSNLGKRYGATVAVDDVTLEVREGEIFGLIGPNGAGKTTTMECVQGLRRPDRGAIRVLGLDPHRDAGEVRQRIGVQHQEAQLQKRIKVWEAVELWAHLYARTIDPDELLKLLGLSGKRDAGLFFPLSALPTPVRLVTLALPTTHAVALMQATWDGAGWRVWWPSALGLVVIFAVCTAASTRLFRWE
jgi:ABC-2 type transport system ATP-binding protein